MVAEGTRPLASSSVQGTDHKPQRAAARRTEYSATSGTDVNGRRVFPGRRAAQGCFPRVLSPANPLDTPPSNRSRKRTASSAPLGPVFFGGFFCALRGAWSGTAKGSAQGVPPCLQGVPPCLQGVPPCLQGVPPCLQGVPPAVLRSFWAALAESATIRGPSCWNTIGRPKRFALALKTAVQRQGRQTDVA